MTIDVYNQKNEVVGKEELPDTYFGVRWNPVLVRQVLIAFLANQRKPWAHVKGRGEVRGGGRKPWRQKGTGRARHGSIRSPLWRKGGKSHGPTNEKDYSQKVNKKMKRTALFSALSQKVKDHEFKVVDTLSLATPKTKLAYAMTLALLGKPRAKKIDVLLVRESKDTALVRAARNMPKTKVVAPGSLNLYDVMNYKHVLVDRRAIAQFVTHYTPK